MKHRPLMYYEPATREIHCEGASGVDFTLCGFSLDGDQGAVTETTAGAITCRQCLGIIDFCQGISRRSLALGR